MLVGILEVARIASPERLLRRFDDPAARGPGLCHYSINFGSRRDVVRETQVRCAATAQWQPCVLREARAGPERQPKSGLKVEEGDGSMLELLPNDPVSLQAEAIPIEANGALQVVDAERYQ